MPSVKASDVQTGQVLIDPDGHLYEIQGVRVMEDEVFMWLWPDSSDTPNMFQSFGRDEEINFIRGVDRSE
jgi:hypothetical protein